MMIIDIDPACYTTNPGAPKYNKYLAAQYAAKQIHKAVIALEIDSIGAPNTPVEPANTLDDMANGSSSKRNFRITVRPRLVDETYMQYSMTGLQGSFMFQLAAYVLKGVVRVRDQATGTERTAKQILDYAIASTAQAGVWA